MRILITAAGAAALLLMTGCSESEAQVKIRLRGQIVDQCKSQGASQSAQMPGLNLDTFCSCLADKSLEGRSLDDIRRLDGNQSAAQQAGMDAGMQCAQAQAASIQAAAGAAAPQDNAAAGVAEEGGANKE